MLQPKRSKYRRAQKGKMKGNAQRGNQLAFGSFGIKALEQSWITGRQIEAARQAVTRHMKREGQLWIRIFPDRNLLRYVWGKEKEPLKVLLYRLPREEFCWKPKEFRMKLPRKPFVLERKNCR
jgi:ribosomal protein L16/L10AE